MIVTGALACSLLALGSELAHGPRFVRGLERGAAAVVAGSDVRASFRDSRGWLTRHPRLSGGSDLPAAQRAQIGGAIAAVPGIGGARWISAGRPDAPPVAIHCQDDVEGLLHARSIRFGEASATIDPVSEIVLDEVATALRPCLGSIVAIIGHTDAAGDQAANVALSASRAEAVRQALVRRGIPGDGLRAKGVGAAQPVDGLEPADPANRRIEFSIIAPAPLAPTPIDTPGAG